MECNPDRELVLRCIDGDRKSQEILYRKFASKMYGVCLGYSRKPEEAQDILQDGFIKAFASLHKYEGSGSLEGWIRKIIINTAVDYYRKNLKTLPGVDEQELNYFAIDAEVYSKLNNEEIIRLIRQLPEGARIIFNLYAVEGYNHNEIAAMLNISVGTSKSQYSRARSLLQSMLNKVFDFKPVL